MKNDMLGRTHTYTNEANQCPDKSNDNASTCHKQTRWRTYPVCATFISPFSTPSNRIISKLAGTKPNTRNLKTCKRMGKRQPREPRPSLNSALNVKTTIHTQFEPYKFTYGWAGSPTRRVWVEFEGVGGSARPPLPNINNTSHTYQN